MWRSFGLCQESTATRHFTLRTWITVSSSLLSSHSHFSLTNTVQLSILLWIFYSLTLFLFHIGVRVSSFLLCWTFLIVHSFTDPPLHPPIPNHPSIPTPYSHPLSSLHPSTPPPLSGEGLWTTSEAVTASKAFHLIDGLAPGSVYTVRLLASRRHDSAVIFEDVIHTSEKGENDVSRRYFRGCYTHQWDRWERCFVPSAQIPGGPCVIPQQVNGYLTLFSQRT